MQYETYVLPDRESERERERERGREREGEEGGGGGVVRWALELDYV